MGRASAAARSPRPISPRSRSTGVTHDSRAVACRARCSWRSPDSMRTATTSRRPRSRRGAAGLIVERPLPGVAAAQLVVDAARPALASAAAWWYGDPSHELTVVGITGTDGKTTTAYLAVAALEAAGLATGMIGTIATRIGGRTDDHAAHATTPEAPELQATLRAMVDAGDRVAVVETTSHGLALERVAGVAYDVAILTNVTHEHLELHGTWEAYRDAKLSLFDRLRLTRGDREAAPGAVDRDRQSRRPVGRRVHRHGAATPGRRSSRYGTEAAADVRATRVTEDGGGLHAEITTPDGRHDARPAPRWPVQRPQRARGRRARRGARAGSGARPRGARRPDHVPGRMERIELGQPFGVIVDFAHSPASLTTVLDLLAPAAAARGGGLIAVFGSAGERDTAKRPQMGRIAGERCRLVVVTDEDPRGEDREAILDEIARGAEAAGRRRGHDLLLIADRRAAIAAAFEAARPGDIVLLAGKGHERSIIGPDGERPWDERAVAEELLREASFGGIGDAPA